MPVLHVLLAGSTLPILGVGFASAALLDRLAGARATFDRLSGALLVLLGLYLLWMA